MDARTNQDIHVNGVLHGRENYVPSVSKRIYRKRQAGGSRHQRHPHERGGERVFDGVAGLVSQWQDVDQDRRDAGDSSDRHEHDDRGIEGAGEGVSAMQRKSPDFRFDSTRIAEVWRLPLRFGFYASDTAGSTAFCNTVMRTMSARPSSSMRSKKPAGPTQ